MLNWIENIRGWPGTAPLPNAAVLAWHCQICLECGAQLPHGKCTDAALVADTPDARAGKRRRVEGPEAGGGSAAAADAAGTSAAGASPAGAGAPGAPLAVVLQLFKTQSSYPLFSISSVWATADGPLHRRENGHHNQQIIKLAAVAKQAQRRRARQAPRQRPRRTQKLAVLSAAGSREEGQREAAPSRRTPSSAACAWVAAAAVAAAATKQVLEYTSFCRLDLWFHLGTR